MVVKGWIEKEKKQTDGVAVKKSMSQGRENESTSNPLGDQVDSCYLLKTLVDDAQRNPSKVLGTAAGKELSQLRARVLSVLVTIKVSRPFFDFYSFTDGMIRPLDLGITERFIV